MSIFWGKWLTVWCLSVGLFGLILLGAGAEATSGPTRLVFQILAGPGDLNLDAHMRFALSLLGAVSIGWSLTFFAAFKAASQLEKSAAVPVWFLIAASGVCWFVIDSCLSVYTGFWRNTIPNTAYIVTFLLPIIRSGALRR